MSIANKLIYLNTTKEKLKDSINNIGGSITDETTFRAYATELDNIYTNLPKTTGEGSNLSLTTLKGRINVEAVKGDTEQDTTNGYQLLDLTLAKLKTYNTSGTWNNNVYTISGVTITINDDMSIKVNGTTTEQVGLLLDGGAISYPTGTYYLSGAINGSNTTYDVRIFNYDGTSAVAQCFTGTKQVAIVNNSQSFNIALIVRSGVTCNNVMFYPMLSTTNTSNYEPYTNGASPNPSYPQEINVATGTQEVVVSNKNLCTNAIKFNNNYLQFFFDKEALQSTFTLSFITDVATSNNSIIIYEDTTQLYSFTNRITGNANERVSGSVTLTNEQLETIKNASGEITLRVYKSGANWNSVTEAQIENNSVASSYIAHQEQTQQLRLGDIELAKIGSYVDRIYKEKDKWYIEKNIGKVANKTNWVVGSIVSNNRCSIPLNSNGLADTINNYNGINCISNCLIATSQGTQATSTDINTISINNANAYVKFDDATNTRELVKAKMDSMTNFVFYYILITPTYTEITNTTLIEELNELEKIMSYNGQTNISVTGSLPMILSVSALKGE